MFWNGTVPLPEESKHTVHTHGKTTEAAPAHDYTSESFVLPVLPVQPPTVQPPAVLLNVSCPDGAFN